MIPCAQRDALYCLHENGCITLRVCRSTTTPEEGAGILDEGSDKQGRGCTTDRGCSLPLCFSEHLDAHLSLVYCATKSLILILPAILSIICFMKYLFKSLVYSFFLFFLSVSSAVCFSVTVIQTCFPQPSFCTSVDFYLFPSLFSCLLSFIFNILLLSSAISASLL